MVGADPVSGPGDAGRTVSAPANNLVLRVISAVVLAPVAIYAAYLGGWPFTVFWAAAALAVLWEWISLVTGLGWIIAGIGYAGIMLLAPLLLRADNAYGFLALVLLFAIVWTTDVLGYFAGRAFGGPKLLPAVSPKKTWSGAIAGTLGAMIVAVLVGKLLWHVQYGPRLRSLRCCCRSWRSLATFSNPGSSASSAPKMPAISFPAMAA